MNTALSAAIVGGGFMAGVHSRSIRVAGARLAGVVGSNPRRSIEIQHELRAERSFESLDQLLSDPVIDVVHICTPNSTHRAIAEAVLRAGKHVVCEKPLATSVADALSLVDLADATGLVAAVPFVYRFHPMVRHMRERISDGRAGVVASIQGAYLQDWMSDESDTDWRTDSATGGSSRAFGDIGSHLVDLIEFVGGDRISSITAVTRTVHPERKGRPVDTEDLAAVLFETIAGAVGTLLVSQVAPGRKNGLRVELNGSLESLVFNQESPDEIWVGRRSESSLISRDPALGGEVARLSAAPAGHPLGYLDAFAAMVADTYSTIKGEQVIGLPTFADGLRATEITEAVLQSTATGSRVRLGIRSSEPSPR